MTRNQLLLSSARLLLLPGMLGPLAIPSIAFSQQPASIVAPAQPDTQKSGKAPVAQAGAAGAASQAGTTTASSATGVLPPGAGGSPAVTAGERLTTRVSLDAAMPVQQPGSWARVTGRLMDVPDARVREKVVVSGIATYEPAEGGVGEVRARTQWTSVERTDTRARKILEVPLESAVRVPTSMQEMPPGQPLTASGDVASLEAAALSLFAEEAQSSEASGSGAPSAVEQSRASGQAPQSASGAGQQGAFPDKLEAEPFRADADVAAGLTEVVSTTSEGCTPIIDLVNGTVKQTSQLVTNGKPSGSCSENGTSFQIKHDNTTCTDEVDVAGLTAYGRARAFYVNSQAEVIYLQASCEREEGKEFDIAEDETACTVQTDLTAMVATPRAELAYVNGRGQRTVVRGCQPVSDGAPIPITLSSDGCSLNHDFPGGVSTQYQMARYTYYTQIIQASGCQAFDASPEYPHTRTATGCSPISDVQAGFAYPSFQTQIDMGQGPVQILACQPDMNAGVALMKTADGCTDRFSHSVPAAQSFGMSRLYHSLTGSRTYVDDCSVDPEQLYIHQISEPVAWQNNDVNRTGTALRRITISAHGNTVEVQGAQILAGEPAVPYSYVRQDVVPDLANVVYEACQKTTPTVLADIYTRPDGTQYNQAIGAGDTIGPVNSCTSIIQTPVWKRVSTSQYTYNVNYGTATTACYGGYNENGCSGGMQPYCQYQGYYAGGYASTSTYQGTRKLQRDDGVVIEQVSKNNHSITATNGAYSAGNGFTSSCPAWGAFSSSYPAYPPEIHTGSEQIAWNQAEGW